MHLLPKMKKIGVPLLKKVKLLSFLSILPCLAFPDAEPLKVFILCGQSNMEGHAKPSTFEHIGMDPKTAPILKDMLDADGKPRTLDDVYIAYGRSEEEEQFGKLCVGYGGKKHAPKAGPEYTFGIYMHKALQEPFLIIKTAWGGKDIAKDFRPPSSAGTFDRFCQLPDCNPFVVGHFYKVMLEDIKKLLMPGVIGTIYPDLANMTAEISGFGWFQGWNDGCNLNYTAGMLVVVVVVVVGCFCCFK